MHYLILTDIELAEILLYLTLISGYIAGQGFTELITQRIAAPV